VVCVCVCVCPSQAGGVLGFASEGFGRVGKNEVQDLSGRRDFCGGFFIYFNLTCESDFRGPQVVYGVLRWHVEMCIGFDSPSLVASHPCCQTLCYTAAHKRSTPSTSTPPYCNPTSPPLYARDPLTLNPPIPSTTSPSPLAFLSNLPLTSATNSPNSTTTPAFSGCPSSNPISLILTLPCACSSSPRITAKGTPPASAALNCASSFGFVL